MVDALKIALNAWIIQDGNYGEFDVGDVAAFAVEFYPDLDATEIVAPVPAGPSIRHVANATYRVTCPIVHLAPDWWVIDIGLPTYHSGAAPRGAALGKWLQAGISLGIDPFFYFERLAKTPGAPALIFDWSVDAIEIQTAPFIEKAPGLMARDPARRAWKPIARTDAWHDDNGNAEYLLQCSLKGRTPRWSLD
jgi:hypothetical protein